MVLMNYHELTMNEARDSPQRRKQFLVICAVMASTFVYAVLTAGGLSPVNITEGEFPGGDFIFRQTKRDYAASNGLARSIGTDLGLKPKHFADVIYNVYLDNPAVVTGGRQQRFAAGLLVAKHQGEIDTHNYKRKLLAMNEQIIPATEEEFWDLSASDLWPRLKYEQKSLPKTKAAVLQFPFTDGFVSALILSHKVIPALHNYVKEKYPEKDIPVVVVTTCSTTDDMCTHYVPLSNTKPFLLGNPEMKVYAETLEPPKLIRISALKKLFPFVKYFEGIFGSKSDEL